jgi:nucleotide-binding universal stress UspA family protein
MIGFIAGAGIVVRNSIILVDFVELRMRGGMPLAEAVVDAGAVRFRPMMLTAAAVIVGSSVMLFDPIFQGLAISLMAGEVASLLLSRMAVPVLFYLSEMKPSTVPSAAAKSNNIICAVDFSESSVVALGYADVIARDTGDELTVVHALAGEPPPYFTESQIPELITEEDAAEAAMADSLEKWVAQIVDRDTRPRLVVSNKSPVSAIIEECEVANARLVAIGSHGRTGLQKLRFGSVAENVLAEIDIPVMIAGKGVQTDVPESISTILVATDLSPQSAAAVIFALELAGAVKARLLTVHVVPNDEAAIDEDLLRSRCEELMPTDIDIRCSVEHIVKRGDVVAAIANEAIDKSVDLIVIGVEHHVFGDEAFGEKVRSIISSMHRPVVVVPASISDRSTTPTLTSEVL